MQVGQRSGVSVGPRASREVAETCRDTVKVQTWSPFSSDRHKFEKGKHLFLQTANGCLSNYRQ
jgi:hypothetical protein